MKAQTRQPDLWVVVDNSSDPNDTWVGIGKEHPHVLYDRVGEPHTIGWMRNRCLDLALKAGAEYIVFWDDDDYYPPRRIEDAIAALEANPTAELAGSSKMYLLVLPENTLMTVGPYGPNHSTAATMVIRRRYAEANRFNPEKEKGEEFSFTKGWTAPVAQVNAETAIVAMGHTRNTVNKSQVVHKPRVFAAESLNNVNGKQVFRMRWPVQWDLFRRTFSV
jgi:glycosyltransferase involved in cell wall biosynthesis